MEFTLISWKLSTWTLYVLYDCFIIYFFFSNICVLAIGCYYHYTSYSIVMNRSFWTSLKMNLNREYTFQMKMIVMCVCFFFLILFISWQIDNLLNTIQKDVVEIVYSFKLFTINLAWSLFNRRKDVMLTRMNIRNN